MLVHMGTGLVMTNASTALTIGLCISCGNIPSTAANRYGQPTTAAIAAMPFPYFLARTQSMPCQIMQSSIRS